MRHWQLRSPATEREWQQYFQLRWQILRAPWSQPLGSERDELEAQAYHQMLVTPGGDIAAVGRIHQIDACVAQVRYMAVADAYQGQGAGRRVLAALEQAAVSWGCNNIVLNARDTAEQFYQRLGYQPIGMAAALYGISHVKMQKHIRLVASPEQFALWCAQLGTTWQQTIPLSQFMQLQIERFDGNELRCSAPMAPNINLHQTMFAGSIYTLATLTGWGMLYLQLQAAGLHGHQVLADASIKYIKPIVTAPNARCVLQQCIGSLNALLEGHKVVQQITVQVLSGTDIAAEFTGRFVVLPAKTAD